MSSSTLRRWRKTCDRSHQQHAPVVDTESSHHFPTEIIEIILDFLNTDLEKDFRIYSYPDLRFRLLPLALVARAWREPTQRVLLKELRPTSYQAATSLLKVVSRNPRLASYARTINAPSCWKMSLYDCNEIVDLFQQLWLCCPNVTAVAIPIHPRYIVPTTGIWDHGPGLTHLVLNQSTRRNSIRKSKEQDTVPLIELDNLTRLTLYRWHHRPETGFLRQLVLPKLKQLDLLMCSLEYQEMEPIWNSPTLERLSLIETCLHTDQDIAFESTSIPLKAPRLSILTDYRSHIRYNYELFFNKVVALYVHSWIRLETAFYAKYYPQLEFLDFTLDYIDDMNVIFSTIEDLARFIKEKHTWAPKLVALHLTIQLDADRVVYFSLETQVMTVLAYCLYRRCLTYDVSLKTHIASRNNDGYDMYGSMPSFPLLRPQLWTHNHWSISRFIHNASHRRVPLWGRRRRKLPSLASLWHGARNAWDEVAANNW